MWLWSFWRAGRILRDQLKEQSGDEHLKTGYGEKKMNRLKLGELQKLTVVKKVEFGVYLAGSKETMEERVLLPAKQVPDGCETGDELEVFLYKDSKDRLIATVNRPKLMMGQIAL